jgi:hypothetical protein
LCHQFFQEISGTTKSLAALQQLNVYRFIIIKFTLISIRADLDIQESWITLKHLQGHLSCRAAGLAWSQNITAVMNGFPWVSNDSDHQVQSKEQSQVRWQTRILTHLQLNKTETCSLIKIFFEHHYAIMLYLHCLTSQDRMGR